MLRISYLVELNYLMHLCIFSISTLILDWPGEQDRSKPDTSGSLTGPLHLGFQSLAPLPSPWEQAQAGVWRLRGVKWSRISPIVSSKTWDLSETQSRSAKPASQPWTCEQKYIVYYILRILDDLSHNTIV